MTTKSDMSTESVVSVSLAAPPAPPTANPSASGLASAKRAQQAQTAPTQNQIALPAPPQEEATVQTRTAESSGSGAENWTQTGQLHQHNHDAVAPHGRAASAEPSGYVGSAAENVSRAKPQRIDQALELLEMTVRTVSSFVPTHSTLKAPRKPYVAPTPPKVEVVPSKRYERERNKLAIDGRIKKLKTIDPQAQPATMELRQVAPAPQAPQNPEAAAPTSEPKTNGIRPPKAQPAGLSAAQLVEPLEGTKTHTAEQRRLKTLLNCLCMFVLLWVGAVGWQFYTLYGAALTPERTTTQYLDDLRNGDLESATELVDQVSKNASISNQSYIAAERPTDYEISEIRTTGARSAATITWTLDGRHYASDVTLQSHKTGPFRLVTQWSLKTGLNSTALLKVSALAGSGEALGLRVNGTGQEIRVRAGNEGTVLELPPGNYTIDPPLAGPYSEFGAEQTVLAGGNEQAEAHITFTESPTNALLDAAKTEAKSFLDKCLTQLDDPTCPNNLDGTWINPQRVPAFEWELNDEAYTLSADGTKLQIAGQYVLKYSYGALTDTTVNAIEPGSYFHEIERTVSLTWRVTVKGDRVVLDAT